MRDKPTAKKIGMIGSNDVMQYGDSPCLVVGKTWLSATKIKAVLANLEACRAFLTKYDLSTVVPVVSLEAAKEKVELEKKLAALQAQVAQLSAQNNGHNRIDPVQKVA